ncbi:MAG: sigma-54-dependent Fis family transcriptional regulator [Deltaproteobacteria bacterium]|nr:sigma-54-dependent Fis family transcriptional regulator [Deltaproteobacteria bacterium]
MHSFTKPSAAGARFAAAGCDVILVTGHASVDSVVEALRCGAADYLTKPVDLTRLASILVNVARRRELQEEIQDLRGELRRLGRFGPLIGGSPVMQTVYDYISRVAPTSATVFIQGESGTGKELVAETVHRLSRRRKKPFLVLNCGAVSPTLIESEVFGHERGSFSGADRTHHGYFERATGGSLFLDEITEMPIELQVKLLRVLETGLVVRVGAERDTAVDVRVIAATNRNPAQAVTDGKLREDLYYRLAVFPIALPPLSERTGDIEVLADFFLSALNRDEGASKRFAPDAFARLREHPWPGKVRELKNAVQRAFILADDEIDSQCLHDLFQLEIRTRSDAKLEVPVGSSIADAERHLILATLERFGGDKEKAVEVLGISLKTLYNRLNEYKSNPS